MNNSKKTVMDVPHVKCSGCMMCGDLCQKDAITYPVGEDCFWYPSVDISKCVSCGVCFDKCPAMKSHATTGNIDGNSVFCIGAKNKDEEIRWNSTSGGFYSVIATDWVRKGASVCGAIYDEDKMVVHAIGNDGKFIKKTRQSKYAQSRIAGNYKNVKQLVLSGSKVIFTGAPCQAEALYSYLGEKLYNSENLLVIDFICLGIASPMVYEKYIRYLEKKYDSKIKTVHFKDKRSGWRSIGTSIQFQNGKEYYRTGSRDTYMVSYVTDALCMRKSCHACFYRKIPHISDMTIGDFWGIENINPSFDDNRGLSAVILNTDRGIAAFQSIRKEIDYFETTAENIAKRNFTVLKPKDANPKRDEFLHAMYTEPYMTVIRKYCSYSGYRKLITDARYLKSKIGNSLRTKMGVRK